MKQIVKDEPPQEWIAWAAANTGQPSFHYESSDFPRAAVHASLVSEQGAICAYTMRRIDTNCSHVEHLKPQAVSRDENNLAETGDYQNVVACYPQRLLRGDPPMTFGAIFRGNKWDAALFLSPLIASCEVRIRYGDDGRVRANRENDRAAQWTINALGLKAEILTEWRKAAIEAWGLSLTAPARASRGEAERIAASICIRKPDGQFHPYCVALKHAAEEYLRILDRLASRTKYRSRAARKGRKK